MTKPRAEHDLEKAVPFLLARAGARMGNAFARALKTYGISLTEWRVCASLAHTPDQTLSDLSVHAAADLSALSRIVDRLVDRKLAGRKRSADDKRSVHISLSARGIALTREIVPLARRYEAVALTDFSAAEVRVLRDMLVRLYQNATPLL
jgi:DNA-binding MarR family transcriptional regulator